jgi:hypothetical protein
MDCSSSDGLATYVDGTYCYSCNKYTPTKIKFGIEEKKRSIEVPTIKNTGIPKEYSDWINLYNLGVTDLKKYCFWSEEKRRLCFVSSLVETEDDVLTGCWMRSLNEAPKWLCAGSTEVPFIYYCGGVKNEISSNLCLVEDVVSAIRVSEVMDCLALGGTNLKDSILSFINKHPCGHIFIMLDGDSAGKTGAEKIKKQLALFKESTIIRVRKDPKCMTVDQIYAALGGRL